MRFLDSSSTVWWSSGWVLWKREKFFGFYFLAFTFMAHWTKRSSQTCAGMHRGCLFCLAPPMSANKHFPWWTTTTTTSHVTDHGWRMNICPLCCPLQQHKWRQTLMSLQKEVTVCIALINWQPSAWAQSCRHVHRQWTQCFSVSKKYTKAWYYYVLVVLCWLVVVLVLFCFV